MGTVWLVRHLGFDSDRALKLIISGIALDQQVRARFKREAHIMDRLNHPNVVRVYDTRLSKDTAFIEMEYIQGQSLEQLLKLRPGVPMPLPWVTDLLDQLCDVLQTAMDAGIIHRDLKPSNLMVVEGRTPGTKFLKLLDFGIAKIREKDDVRTLTGCFIGTPHYSSPEQIQGEELDARSDLYSVGVILYELLTGHRPFGGPLSSVIYHQVVSPPPPFESWDPDIAVPPEVERVVMQCLAKRRDERPQSPRELAERFHRALDEASRRPSPSPTPVDRRTRRATRRLLACLALAVAAVAIVQIGSRLGIWTSVPRAWSASRSNDPTGGHEGRQDISKQIAVWKGRGYRVDPGGGTSGGWPAILVSEAENLRFRRMPGGIYLPEGFKPGEETDPLDGFPRTLVREDGQTFLRIAGGPFIMGDFDEPIAADVDDPTRPSHAVKLSGYYIQKTEVTNGEFERYLEDIGYNVCAEWAKRYNRLKSLLGEEEARKHPAVGIPWSIATSYARKRGGRLPTEAQWEFAARSRGLNLRRVWEFLGDRQEPVRQLANIDNVGANDFGTEAVGSYQLDATVQGVLDLTGNVREWCRDVYRPYVRGAAPESDPDIEPAPDGQGRDRRVLRGGSFSSPPELGQTTNRDEPLEPGEAKLDVGFRLVIECPAGPSHAS